MAVTIDRVQDPDSVLDWTFDWSRWLDVDETINTATFVTSAGLVIHATPAPAPKTATVWLKGGQRSQLYTITCRITTSAGRTDERSFTLRVQDR